jgi:hypothetical protein
MEAVSSALCMNSNNNSLNVIGVIVIEAPENITVGLGQDDLTLTCRVRNASSLFMEFDSNTSLDIEVLNKRGIFPLPLDFLSNGTKILRVKMELRNENNNSRVACLGRDSDEKPYASEFAYVTILGMLCHNKYTATCMC